MLEMPLVPPSLYPGCLVLLQLLAVLLALGLTLSVRSALTELWVVVMMAALLL
jgi:hypothetical protein